MISPAKGMVREKKFCFRRLFLFYSLRVKKIDFCCLLAKNLKMIPQRSQRDMYALVSF